MIEEKAVQLAKVKRLIALGGLESSVVVMAELTGYLERIGALPAAVELSKSVEASIQRALDDLAEPQ